VISGTIILFPPIMTPIHLPLSLILSLIPVLFYLLLLTTTNIIPALTNSGPPLSARTQFFPQPVPFPPTKDTRTLKTCSLTHAWIITMKKPRSLPYLLCFNILFNYSSYPRHSGRRQRLCIEDFLIF